MEASHTGHILAVPRTCALQRSDGEGRTAVQERGRVPGWVGGGQGRHICGWSTKCVKQQSLSRAPRPTRNRAWAPSSCHAPNNNHHPRLPRTLTALPRPWPCVHPSPRLWPLLTRRPKVQHHHAPPPRPALRLHPRPARQRQHQPGLIQAQPRLAPALPLAIQGGCPCRAPGDGYMVVPRPGGLVVVRVGAEPAMRGVVVGGGGVGRREASALGHIAIDCAGWAPRGRWPHRQV